MFVSFHPPLQVNENGGLLGKPVFSVITDTGSTALGAVMAALKFASSHQDVRSIVGLYDSTHVTTIVKR